MEQYGIPRELLNAAIQLLLPILDKQTVIFFTGGAADAGALTRQVDSLLATEAPIVVSESFRRMADEGLLQRLYPRLLQDAAHLYQATGQAHLAVVPILTRNTLAKVAMGIQDTPVTSGIAAVLMQGKPVIAIRNHYHPDSSLMKDAGYHQNPAYNRLLLDYEDRLQSFGVQIIDSSELVSTLKHALYPGIFEKESTAAIANPVLDSCVITYSDVRSAVADGCITIAQNARLTPLAEEYLTGRQIKIIRR